MNLEQFNGTIELLTNIGGTLLLVFLAYMLFYKSAISRLWWPLVAPILEPLGFRHVCMDMSYGLFAIRYVPTEVD